MGWSKPHSLSCNYNGIGLLAGQRVRRCFECGLMTHRWENRLATDQKPKDPISVSHDGFYMISRRVRTILEGECGVENVEFIRLQSGYFVLRPLSSIFLDLSNASPSLHGEALKTHDPRCRVCGRLPGEFWDSRRIKIMRGQGMVHDDEVLFAGQAASSGDTKSPGIIIGAGIVEVFTASRLGDYVGPPIPYA